MPVVDSVHPEYVKQVDNWTLVRASVEGDSAIRRDIQRYLPPPPGLVNSVGEPIDRYKFYSTFAEFPEIIAPTLNGIQGLIHEKPPVVKLPPDMEYLIKTATPDGTSLQELWEKFTKEMMITGRIVTLAEIYDNKFYICPYAAETMINWHVRMPRDGGDSDFVVFRETVQSFTPESPFDQTDMTIFRVLQLIDGIYRVTLWIENPDEKVRETAPFVILKQEGDPFVEPVLYGKTMDYIPVTVTNTLDTTFNYGAIPMLPLARRAVSIFRKTADYNRSLYTKGDPQPILWGIGEDDVPSVIGGGEIWVFTNSEGKAQYLDIDGQGIPLQRQSIEDEFQRFSDEVGTLFEGSATGYESGEALRRRQALRQATMKSLVINAAEGMEESLKTLALAMGKSPAEIDAIKFGPNLDFAEPAMSGQELLNLMQAKGLGAPMSVESIHALLKRRQLTLLEWEIEKKQLDNEDELKIQTSSPSEGNAVPGGSTGKNGSGGGGSPKGKPGRPASGG